MFKLLFLLMPYVVAYIAIGVTAGLAVSAYFANNYIAVPLNIMIMYLMLKAMDAVVLVELIKLNVRNATVNGENQER